MTILPKKKPQRDKTEAGESSEHSASRNHHRTAPPGSVTSAGPSSGHASTSGCARTSAHAWSRSSNIHPSGIGDDAELVGRSGTASSSSSGSGISSGGGCSSRRRHHRERHHRPEGAAAAAVGAGMVPVDLDYALYAHPLDDFARYSLPGSPAAYESPRYDSPTTVVMTTAMATSQAGQQSIASIGGASAMSQQTACGVSPSSLSGADLLSSGEHDLQEGYNSEEEHLSSGPNSTKRRATGHLDYTDEREIWFEETLKKERKWIIKRMATDGNCLFRAVADQIFGDQDMHDVVRKHCIDYMAKNADYFSAYVAEDFAAYLGRKLKDGCHGNHVEIQAMCEMYNRPIEIYQYGLEPINTFSSSHKTDNEPMRLSYHFDCHYNSIVNPYKATVGVGLGLPGFQPGQAEKNLMREAASRSELYEIEQRMLADKTRETDWELTQDALEEQVARESYLQWLRDEENRCGSGGQAAGSSGKKSRRCTSSSTTTPCGGYAPLSPPGASRGPSSSSHPSSQFTPTPTQSPHACGSMQPQKIDSLVPQQTSVLPSTKDTPSTSQTVSAVSDYTMPSGAECAAPRSRPSTSTTFEYDWVGDDQSDILAQIIAKSQQEYLDSLKQQQGKQQQPKHGTTCNEGSGTRLESTSRSACPSNPGSSRANEPEGTCKESSGGSSPSVGYALEACIQDTEHGPLHTETDSSGKS